MELAKVDLHGWLFCIPQWSAGVYFPASHGERVDWWRGGYMTLLLCLHSGDWQGTSLVPTRTLSHVHVEQRAFWVHFSPPNGYTFFCGYEPGLTPFLWLAWGLFSLLLFSAFQVLSSQSLGWPSKPWGQLWACLLLASEHLLPRTWTWPISSAEVAFFSHWILAS